jgi:hypothetical protein
VRARWLLGALPIAALVAVAVVVGWNEDDDHEEAWCGLYREVGAVVVDGEGDDLFVDPSPEVVRLAEKLNELGFPPKLAAVAPVIAGGPVAHVGEEPERYDEAVGALEAFLADECRLAPETLAPIRGRG